MNIEPVEQVSHYVALQPLFRAMNKANDNLPKSSFPTENLGTVISNAHVLPPVTLYNSHGILEKTNPNSLIGYA